MYALYTRYMSGEDRMSRIKVAIECQIMQLKRNEHYVMSVIQSLYLAVLRREI